MTDRLSRWLKTALCVLAVVAYGYLYRGYLRPPLMEAIAGLPGLVQRVLIVLSLLPVFLVATYYVACVLKPADKARQRH